MSRPLRIEYPDAWYHIMNRGRRNENIFEWEEDRKIFIALLKESAKLWNVRISAYCLLDTHYHILAQTPLGNLSRFMSSHQGYLSWAKSWDWLCKDFILTMLATDTRKQRKAYREFMGQEDSDELLGIFERKKLPSLLGSDKFITWIKKTFFEQKKDRQVPESVQLAPDLQDITREVCRVYGAAEKDLLTAQRGRSNEPRAVAIYLGRVLRNDTLKELGRFFGMTGYSPAGSAVERVKKQLLRDKKLQKKIDGIKKSLFLPDKGQGET